VPDVLPSVESTPPIAHRRRFVSPPPPADATEERESAPAVESVPVATQNEFLRFFESKKRKLEEIDELRDTLAAELADMERMAKRFKSALDRSSQTSPDFSGEGSVGTRVHLIGHRRPRRTSAVRAQSVRESLRAKENPTTTL
jgi:hypothetical protein